MASQLPSFDVLMDLAQNNPEQLENLRKSLTEEIIHDTHPNLRHKLEGINFKVDMERQRCKTPLQSGIKIAALMHDSFDQMRDELDALFKPINQAPNQSTDRPSTLSRPRNDNVIPFIRPH